MRKILIYTIFLFPFIACHLKEEEPSKPKEEITDKNDPFQEFKKELGIPQEVEIQGQESGYPDPENTYTIGKYKNTFYFFNTKFEEGLGCLRQLEGRFIH